MKREVECLLPLHSTECIPSIKLGIHLNEMKSQAIIARCTTLAHYQQHFMPVQGIKINCAKTKDI